AALGRALAIAETDGFVKLIADAESDELLGMAVVGPEASDLISEGSLALEMGAFLPDLALTIHPHPTLGEAIMEAAKAALGERGGDVTYHGPGQLVGYPILKLDDDERDLHGYLRALEEALLGVCSDLGVAARRNPGWTGVWIGERKVASIGIAVRRWVTMHG